MPDCRPMASYDVFVSDASARQFAQQVVGRGSTASLRVEIGYQ